MCLFVFGCSCICICSCPCLVTFVSCICPCLAIFVTVFVIVFVFVFVIVVATLVSRSSQVIFVFVFFFFLSSLYLSWSNYTGLKIFASCGDSYFAFKLQFIVQQKHHCFYQKNLPILWCWMNVFDDSIKSNGGFECLSPKLELKVNVETSKVFALNGIE